ncbi:MAG: hypothetical protein NZ480_00825 [Bdellovibrionaceae bacterium]|nr:hypothetical protein [Pseudobdellovibrionaceae bacterium]MDW8189883.1 hypothetical protein [Pseudobdellovibrionaceae bacterium]
MKGSWSRRQFMYRISQAAGAALGTTFLFQNCGGFKVVPWPSSSSNELNSLDDLSMVNDPSSFINQTPVVTRNPSLIGNPNSSTNPLRINGVILEPWSQNKGTPYGDITVLSAFMQIGNTNRHSVIYVGLPNGSRANVLAGQYLEQPYDSNFYGSVVSEILVFNLDSRQLLGHRIIKKDPLPNSSPQFNPQVGVVEDNNRVQATNGLAFAYVVLPYDVYQPPRNHSFLVVVNDRRDRKYYYKIVTSNFQEESNSQFARVIEPLRGIIYYGPGYLDLPRVAGINDSGISGANYSSAGFSGHIPDISRSGNSVTVEGPHGYAGPDHNMHSAHLFDQSGNLLAAQFYNHTSGQARYTFNNLNLNGITFLRAIVSDTVNGRVTAVLRI